LDIQNYRYPGKFNYDILISNEIRRVYVPKLILQPVVENAILHAFQQLPEGRIQLAAQEVPEGIRLHILDNGSGMTAEQLDQVSDKLTAADSNGPYKGGVGLRNVHQRIRHKYGAPYGLTLASDKQNGTCVTILIPRLGGAL
jgi:two-component system, sensor histidine kinase YesM